MTVDVAVVGLGAMGSAALWRSAARGASVVGFEQFEIGHDQGSSHGDSRMIRTAYFEGPQYVPLVQSAFDLWRQLERESGASLLTVTGALMIGDPSSELVSGALSSAISHNLAHELLDASAAAARYPQFRLASGEVALYEEQAGILKPEPAVMAMVERARALGATVKPSCTVRTIESTSDGMTIVTDGGKYHARRVIVSAGAWLTKLVPSWSRFLSVERQIFTWFPMTDAAMFNPARFPVFIHETAPGRMRYGFPTLDGVTAKVGVHHDGKSSSLENVDRTVHARDLDAIQQYVSSTLPGLVPIVERSKVCLYTNTPDQHFLIGSPHEQPAVTVVSACSGHGFKYASVLGDAAADLALTGETAHPIELFSPARLFANEPKSGSPIAGNGA